MRASCINWFILAASIPEITSSSGAAARYQARLAIMSFALSVGVVLIIHLSTHLVTGHGGHADVVFDGDPYSPDGCNNVRGCFLCDGCGANVAWEPDPHENVIKFTVWGPITGNTGHVSLGISTSEEMFDSDIYSCISDAGTTSLKRYRTVASPGRAANTRTLKGVSGQDVALAEGEIRCQYYRNMSLDDNDPEFYDVSGNQSSYYLLLSVQSALNGGNIMFHDKWGASTPVILSQAFSAGEQVENPILMQLHGCFMIIAWLGLASIGITMARYFKPMWPNSKLCGDKVWFAVHRACMVSALLLFVTGFILIFVHIGGLIDLSSTTPDGRRRAAHAICGIIATCLGILNPIMAVFRPHPGTSNRPIFNWAHWGVGTVGYLLAIATIGLALASVGGNTIIPALETYSFWILISFVCFLILTWLLLELLRCVADSAGRSDDIPLSSKNSGPPEPQDDSPNPSGAVMKNILLFIFMLGTVFVVAFLVITIALI